MRLSQLIGSRYKEWPAEATLESHAFLLRGGYARQVANGIYSLLPPGFRVIHKIEEIIRQEMDRVGAQEILMPVVMPRELWEESGRYQAVGSELVRFSDRTGHGMVLGMTHEEGVVHLCRNEITSYAQLPFSVYQIQTKFRDEPRSRGGLIRVREFTMKDAYSFHTTQEDLERLYQEYYHAYERIFARVGLPEVIAVESDTGMMGGKIAHEFILLCDAGEDTIAVCDSCSYRANLEVATGRIDAYPQDPQDLEKVHTPNMKTIEEVANFLGVQPCQTAKVVFYDHDADGKLAIALIRGDLDVNEMKIAKVLQAEPIPASEERISACGTVPGFASPIGLDPEKVRVIVDHTIAESNNLVCGANETDYHFKNFNLQRDLPGTQTVDIATLPDGAGCPLCEGTINYKRGIEVGNIFQLGTKYTQAMEMSYTDEKGGVQTPIMGCYGIGVGRLMSSVMEVRHDKFGPQWPIAIAPWQVHINALKYNRDEVKQAADTLYDQLNQAGIEVIFDNRNASPGVQFADADLLGIPIRIIVSERNLKNGEFEYKRRDKDEKGAIPVQGAVETIKQWIDQAIAELQPND